MRICIQNGTVVNAHGRQKADVLVENGVITEVGESIVLEGARCIDAAGCYVFPGFIDPHTHFDLNVGGTVTADDFASGTRAALRGGTTTILDFAEQKRGGTLQAAVDRYHKKAAGSSCNYGFHLALSQWSEQVGNEMAAMRAKGISSYKMYMVYENLRVDDGEIYCAMRHASALGAIISMHCENWPLLLRMIEAQRKKDLPEPVKHALSRPAENEAEAVNRYLRIAQLAKAPAYVVHLSTNEGLQAAMLARARGQQVYLETCPQYLLLDERRYQDADGAKYVMSPPLRTPADCNALFAALGEGAIDTIGTDHCSFTMAQKAAGAHDFTKIPNGTAGVETRPVLYYTYGVRERRVTLEQMAAQLSANAARIFSMYPQKGCIAPGSDADIVVWEPGYTQTLSHMALLHRCDNTPYEGMQVYGRARDVLLGGVLAVEQGAILAPGCGKYVKRGATFGGQA